MKYLILVVALFAPYSLAQEANKDGYFILVDEKTFKDCQKHGCLVIPFPALEPVVIEVAKMMCGKSV